MAEQQSAAISAAFPAPPPFFQHFTPGNLARLEEIRNSAADSSAQHRTPSLPSLLDLPPELRYLIPPPPPATGTYRIFGDTYNISQPLPNLKEQGTLQLYPFPPHSPQSPGTSGTQSEWTLDRAFYLKKLAKSLLLNFMEMVGLLSIAPQQYIRKINDLEVLFINAHHLINEYRPHQARQTLIMMMEEQLARTRSETTGINKMKERVDEILKSLANEGLVEDGVHDSGSQVETRPHTARAKRLMEGRRIWDALERELGS